jgi:hypothetical protein
LEVAAENLRQLGRSVGEQSRLSEIGAALKQAKDLRTAAFGADSEEQIQSQIDVLHATYCADKSTTTDPLAQCNELTQALNARIADSSADLRRHVTLKDSASLNLQAHVDSVRVANGQLAVAFEPLVAEKLEVLRFARGFADKLVVGEKEVHCPACGQAIQVEGFKEHIRAERERLSGLIVTFETRRAAIATLCDTLKSLKANLARNDVTSWRDELATGPLAEHLTYLDLFDAEGLRNSCNEDDLKAIEVKLLPLIDAAASASADAPPGAEQLSDDRQTVESGRAMIEATGQTRTLDRASVVSRKQLYSV